MTQYHGLLNRQIKKIFPDPSNIPPEIRDLLNKVSESYRHFESDRELLERSMDISSRELTEVNSRLSQDIEQQKILFSTLKGAVTELFQSDTESDLKSLDEGNLISLAEILKEQIQKRKAAEANMVALLDNTNDSIWSVNRSMQLVSFNSSFLRKVQTLYNGDLKIGMKPEDIFGIGTQETRIWKAYYDRAIKQDRFVIDRRIKNRDSYLDFEVSCSPIIAEGKVVGVTVFEKDITQRKKAEEAIINAKNEAEAASRAKTEFLANTSHELRTPLNAIIGYSELICESIQEKEYDLVNKDALRIQTAGKHLLELINEILDLSKIEAGMLDIYPEKFAISDMVSHLESITRFLIDRNKNTFHIEVKTDIQTIFGDRGKLIQIIFNLLGNAAKFTEGGRVTLRISDATKHGKPGLCFEIEDTGIGIPPEKIGRLFQPFSQADSSSTRKYGGTGLGLVITRKLCTLLQGDVSLTSHPGEGSTFYVWIPLEIDLPEEASSAESSKRQESTN